ncbi:hypothetical protein GCM10023200_01050 [Actinomycetospora chlora]|uniref:Secreted protein n=1 Tax=Actinomycetospora chlora TaxID=663608 RepID=A0ABP9A282_9PSEU
MGTHSARRPRTISRELAGRGLFTATAAVALVGGSAGMAFAGEAPSHGEGAHETGHQQDQQDCSIPVVDDGTQTVGHVLDGTSGGATGPVLDAADRALAPVHDGLCGPANDVLGQVPGLGSPDDEASPDEEEGTPDEEDAATPTAAAPGATTVTDLPDVPVTS